MIHLTNISKRFDNGTQALDDINIRIEQGEFAYLVGPSGSGKSTLMKVLYREVIPTSGKATVGKYQLNKMKEKQIPFLRREVGVIFQDFKLLANLTVFENVAYAMEVTGKSRKEINKRVTEVLTQVDLRPRAQQLPSELSGGEQQRASVARAIVNYPRILIADEPTGNLDPDNAVEIFQLLERINRNGTTVLLGTHNDLLVNRFRHRLIQLENGRIVRDEYEGDYNESH